MTCVASILLAALAPDVLTVAPDAGGGADFQDLQVAIDAAAPGDTVLVQAGQWTSVSIVGKGIDLVVDIDPVEIGDQFASWGDVFVFGGISIRDVPAGQRVLVRGLSVQNEYGSYLPALEVLDCPGPVWIQDCDFWSFSGVGARLARSQELVLGRCSVLASGAL